MSTKEQSNLLAGDGKVAPRACSSLKYLIQFDGYNIQNLVIDVVGQCHQSVNRQSFQMDCLYRRMKR